ncbi:hypothetical protein [Terribacillus sp. DMT04]|uniref:YqeB family protein n=1 Tax=Terribacillus sp. DMT04 TaxID=2850441 RepID=UPI001C2C8FA7|nr:hypothetical protein [Terribacillus sp. DMT04]QXE02226.1 hypothetical protein KS242_02955 [Terribacillus sp. DMT04]
MQDIELGLTKIERAAIHVIPPILGAILGWYLPVIAKWILKLPWLPLEDLVEKIASYSGITASAILCIVGAVAGIALSQFIFYETLTVIINKEAVLLKIRKTKDNFRKQDIQSVYLEGKSLVLVGRQDNEMYKEAYDANKEKLAQAFLSLGYPWFYDDPYLAAYRRWEESDLQVPAAAHSLLRARKDYLKDDEDSKARQLQKDLAKMGIAIKDRKGGQYIRLDHTLSQNEQNEYHDIK